jgi:hypothetical protein
MASLVLRPLLKALLIGGLTTVSGFAFANPLVLSTFDTNREGWSATFGANVGAGTIWQPTGGNLGGNLVAPDLGANTLTWFFDASAGDHSPLLGNHADAYGGSLQYDFRIENFAGNYYSNNGDSDIVLSSPAMSGLTLYYSGPFFPNGSYNHFTVPLVASAGWRKLLFFPATQPATEAELQAALANITDLQIRGNYTDAATTSHLDNVGFYSAVPETSSAAFLALATAPAAILVWRRRRR